MGQALIVGARVLPPEDIDEGRRLIGALHASRFEFDAVFWLYHAEAEQWRLTIASPFNDRVGPIKVYTQLDSICNAMNPPLRLEKTDVALARGGDRRVKALLRRFDFKRAEADLIIERQGLDGEYIEAAYLYHLSET